MKTSQPNRVAGVPPASCGAGVSPALSRGAGVSPAKEEEEEEEQELAGGTPASLGPALAVFVQAFATLILGSAVTARAAAAPPPPPRPNIVFIFADDWGWGDLSCHGHPWLKTPHLDRLASEGIDFHQFNVLNPVCSPSRAAAMTGCYPARFSVHQHFASPVLNAQRNMPDWLDPAAPALPRLLKQAGYRTGHFGKWHLTNRDTHGAPLPQAYGIDDWAVFNGGAEWPSADLHGTAANAAAFIEANRERPFYLNVWLHESHTPHVPTEQSLDRWKHLGEQERVYAAVITDGDNAVGQILAALEAAGVAENTLVLFSSDNGPESTAKAKRALMRDDDAGVQGYDTYYSVGQTGGLRGRKRSLFEGGVRVPFIVRWPGRAPAGIKNDTTVLTAVDLLPTLAAAAGATLPPGYQGDGENLLAALMGNPIERSRPIFWQWTGTAAEPDWWPRLAVRQGEWKLAIGEGGERVELHRLSTDRAESKDLADEQPEVVDRLTRLALEWQATLPEKPNPACTSPADRAAVAESTEKPRAARQPAAGGQPRVTAAQRARAFDRWDVNGDNRLTFDEYSAGLSGQANLETRFNNFDTSGDGALTREEFVKSSGVGAEPKPQ